MPEEHECLFGKHDKSCCGGEYHIGIDGRNEPIQCYKVTGADVCDSQAVDAVRDEENSDRPVQSDSAGCFEKQENRQKGKGCVCYLLYSLPGNLIRVFERKQENCP